MTTCYRKKIQPRPPSRSTAKANAQRLAMVGTHTDTFNDCVHPNCDRAITTHAVKKQWKPRVFISYSWGQDTIDRDNQQRVLQLSNALRCTCKVEVWIDTECMHGSLTQSMCRGIDNCDIVLVCITRAYIDKCNKSTNDNCKLELNYAYERRGAHCILPVVMENSCTQQSSWDGPVGAYLNKHVYISCTTDSIMLKNTATIVKHIEQIMMNPTASQMLLPTGLHKQNIVDHWKCTTKAATNTLNGTK